MGRKIELEVTIDPGDADKRQALTSQIDIGLLTAGLRVRAGTYRIVIERVDPRAERPAEEDLS